MSESKQMPDGVNPHTTVDMTHQRVLCPHHGEPFRAKWPYGFMIFSLAGFQRIVWTPAELEKMEGPRSIEALLDIKPTCCRLTKEALLALYLEINEHSQRKFKDDVELPEKAPPLFPEATCMICHKDNQPCCSMQIRDRLKNKTHQYVHAFCMRCVVFQMEVDSLGDLDPKGLLRR